MISQASGRACKSVSRTKRGKGRKLNGIAGLMAMFARSFFCATGNSVPRFPRHGREAGKIACLGSMILGEKRGRCEREMKREKAKKRRRKEDETMHRVLSTKDQVENIIYKACKNIFIIL